MLYLVVFAEAGGSEVNPHHEPHCHRGGITAEMQVSVCMSRVQSVMVPVTSALMEHRSHSVTNNKRKTGKVMCEDSRNSNTSLPNCLRTHLTSFNALPEN